MKKSINGTNKFYTVLQEMIISEIAITHYSDSSYVISAPMAKLDKMVVWSNGKKEEV